MKALFASIASLVMFISPALSNHDTQSQEEIKDHVIRSGALNLCNSIDANYTAYDWITKWLDNTLYGGYSDTQREIAQNLVLEAVVKAVDVCPQHKVHIIASLEQVQEHYLRASYNY